MSKTPLTESLKARIELHEGYRTKLYKCTSGKWTIGIGHNIEDKGLPDAVIDLLFDIDLKESEQEARVLFGNFDDIDIVRQGVLIEMIFQLGRTRLAKFIRFRKAIANGDWVEAKAEMLDSKWAKEDSPARAKKLAEIMEHGQEVDIIV